MELLEQSVGVQGSTETQQEEVIHNIRNDLAFFQVLLSSKRDA